MALIALFTVISFILFRAMRQSDLAFDDTIVGKIECFILGCLKFAWIVGVIFLIFA
jgi:hypothetical protein